MPTSSSEHAGRMLALSAVLGMAAANAETTDEPRTFGLTGSVKF